MKICGHWEGQRGILGFHVMSRDMPCIQHGRPIQKLFNFVNIINAFGSISCMLIVKCIWTCHMEFVLYSLS